MKDFYQISNKKEVVKGIFEQEVPQTNRIVDTCQVPVLGEILEIKNFLVELFQTIYKRNLEGIFKKGVVNNGVPTEIKKGTFQNKDIFKKI